VISLLPLLVNCPNCGSQDVSYTCEPKCCFNHLCGNCYSTFELRTVSLKTKINALEGPQAERDCLAPTTACAVCESLNLFLIDEGQGPTDRLYCTNCHAVLKLEVDAIQSA
jgi:transcription elongation factor Elf1